MDSEQIEKCADWWTDRLKVDGKRAEFRAALVDLIRSDAFDKEERYGYGINLSVDYDPSPTLLAAIRTAGIECRGFMWSAEGVLPMKTSMKIRTDGSIEAHQGRGAPWVQILAPGTSEVTP